ncbi:unnamed protein product [Caenorhabditis nigoni]
MLQSPECQECSKDVTPESLTPEYSVKLNGFKHVLFHRNDILEATEQYVMDFKKIVLKQAFLTELLYLTFFRSPWNIYTTTTSRQYKILEDEFSSKCECQ